MASHSPSSKTRDAGVRLALRLHGDEGAPAAGAVEGDLAADRREDGVILAYAGVGAGMKLGAALAQDDVARQHDLAAEALHAQALAGAVAPVAGTAACFLMCHGSCSLGLRRLGAVGQDLVDPHHRELLAMAALAPVVMAPALLEDDDLVGLALLEQRAGHRGAGD